MPARFYDFAQELRARIARGEYPVEATRPQSVTVLRSFGQWALAVGLQPRGLILTRSYGRAGQVEPRTPIAAAGWSTATIVTCRRPSRSACRRPRPRRRQRWRRARDSTSPADPPPRTMTAACVRWSIIRAPAGKRGGPNQLAVIGRTYGLAGPRADRLSVVAAIGPPENDQAANRAANQRIDANRHRATLWSLIAPPPPHGRLRPPRPPPPEPTRNAMCRCGGLRCRYGGTTRRAGDRGTT